MIHVPVSFNNFRLAALLAGVTESCAVPSDHPDTEANFAKLMTFLQSALVRGLADIADDQLTLCSGAQQIQDQYEKKPLNPGCDICKRLLPEIQNSPDSSDCDDGHLEVCIDLREKGSVVAACFDCRAKRFIYPVSRERNPENYNRPREQKGA